MKRNESGVREQKNDGGRGLNRDSPSLFLPYPNLLCDSICACGVSIQRATARSTGGDEARRAYMMQFMICANDPISDWTSSIT